MAIRTIRCGGGAKPYISPIEWVDLGDLNWSVGDVISIDVKGLSGDTSPVGYTIYTMNAQSTPLPAGITFSTNGLLAGTVLEYQGGTYAFIFDATRPDITITSFLTVTYVALPSVAPSLTDPADVETGLLEEDSIYNFQLVSTNPELNILSYTLDIAGGSDTFDTISVNSSTGAVTFTVAAAQQNTYNLIYKVTDTVTLLTDTASHSVVIDAVTGNAEIPLFASLSSGDLNCEVTGVVPTWQAGGDEFFAYISDASTKSIDIIGGYLASVGSSAITGVALNEVDGDSLPVNWSLDPVTGFLTRTADVNAVLDSVTNLLFVATNDEGDSLDSPAFAITFLDDTAIAPNITGIRASADTNILYVDLDEPVIVEGGVAADYEIGFQLEVNPETPAVYRTLTFDINTAGTSTLAFDVSGVAFTPANTLRLTYTTDSSSLQSVSAGVDVPTVTPDDYVVQEPYIPPTGNNWTRVIDFNGGTIGAIAQLDGRGFDGLAGHSYYSDTEVHDGSRSCQFNINEHDNPNLVGGDFGFWGGQINYDSVVIEGQELWYRVWVWFPIGFEITSGLTEGIKFQRIHVKNASGNNIGYHSTQLRRVSSTRAGLGIATEVDPSALWTNNGGADGLRGADGKGLASIPYGEWVQVEQYIKFSSVPGQGIYRAWVNKQLAFEDKLTRTLKASTDLSDFIYHHTYWNGAVPAYRQSHYIDDIVVTTNTPAETDAAGNACIGLGV